MNLANIANNSATQDNKATKIVERIGFRNNESYLLTTENMLLQTSFPIWKLFYCKCYFKLAISFRIRVTTTGGTTELQENISSSSVGKVLKDNSVDYIPEYAEWLTKNVLYGARTTTQALDTRYRNTCLYYIRGQKNIHNFNEKVEHQFLFIQNTTYVWEMIANGENYDALVEQEVNAWIDDYRQLHPEATNVQLVSGSISYEMGNYQNAEFEVSYEPISECVFIASKSPFQNHKRVIIDNQTNSYIDAERQGLLEYMKANRLGNKMAQINARYETNENTLPSLSQTINDKIIFQKQISVYNNHIDVNYLATENYVLRDYFTGVKAKLRSWRILSGNEALVRAENIKFYINENINSVNNSYRVIPSYTTLNDYLNNFQYCVIQFYVGQGSTRPLSPIIGGVAVDEADAIAVEFTKHIIGKSVIFTIRMLDNYYAGNYISDYGNEDIGAQQKGIGYADENGEIVGGTICFYSQPVPEIEYFGNETKRLKPYSHLYKRGDEDAENLVCQIPFRLYKDNKEIPQISIQFEMNEDANDMFLGKK